ncbi:uncharacterized protein LOC127079633 [Lathyrus oleraceus]|uniref:uncharacterized protein LOC127079633 n=1 Tax=Pisum sativum TaxID=3888 RepID=UPI0021CE24FF|nr:uncharacterized protein LOC127079633 [Pisum sativum]
MPTLDKYSYLVGLSVSNQIPFYGLEEDPKPLAIAKAIHLKKSKIEAHMTSKSGIQGIPSKFLIGRAHYFSGMRSVDAFEAIFALLIYGLVLFPNVDNFVDINAIKIFLLGNLVPTLLGGTYYSIYHRTSKSGGMISVAFWDLNNGLRWSQKIMSLTDTDIVWYNRVYDKVMIIDSCGDFHNVPLLGTKGGINYNPVLACRQFGYAMRGKPNNIWLSSLYLKENEDDIAFKEKISRSWYNICRKGREELGRKDCVSLEPYLQWVQARALDLKMLYPHQEPLPMTDRCPTPVFMTDNEKIHISSTHMQQDRDAWKNKYQIVEFENSKI